MGSDCGKKYPILCHRGGLGDITLTGALGQGLDWGEGGSALFDLLWRRIPSGVIEAAVKEAKAANEKGDVANLLEAAKRHAEEAPPCKPCPEGEMVVKVLVTYPGASREKCNLMSLSSLSGPGTRVIGVYRIPQKANAIAGCTEAQALAAIRDAGGTCLAGEPLPEPVVETWPMVKAGRSMSPSCGRCGEPVLSTDDKCPLCQAPLSGEVPWTPYPANKGC